MDTYGKILCHLSAFHCLYANRFQRITEIYEFLVLVQFSAEGEPSCPGKDGSDRICTCRLSCLVLAVMSCNSAVRSFCFHCISIGSDQYRCHQAKAAEALSHGVALYIAIII